MSEDALSGFSGTVRLFPLPNLVLFPQVVQALHVFEPRYRQMTADALAGDSLITIVLLRGDEPDAVQPAIEAVACLGQIIWHEKLPDGRYNLRLRGVCRVRILEELSTGNPYRTARVELMPDAAPDDLTRLSQLRRELATEVLAHFPNESPARQQLQELFDGEMPLGQVCDVLAYALPLPAEFKQAMLVEVGPDRRAAAIADALRVSAARAERKFPPKFSAN